MNNVLRISESVSLGLHTMALLSREPKRRLANMTIATELHASQHTLAKVLSSLAHAGLVHSLRGPRGGFRLARGPEAISLLEVYEAINGPLSDSSCLLGDPICDGTGCVLGGLLQSVAEQVGKYLSETTLEDLRTCAAVRSRVSSSVGD